MHVVVNGYEFDPGWKDMDAAGGCRLNTRIVDGVDRPTRLEPQVYWLTL